MCATRLECCRERRGLIHSMEHTFGAMWHYLHADPCLPSRFAHRTVWSGLIHAMDCMIGVLQHYLHADPCLRVEVCAPHRVAQPKPLNGWFSGAVCCIIICMQINVCAPRFVQCNMWRGVIHSLVCMFGLSSVQINVCAPRFV
jgi:hypothetical protein